VDNLEELARLIRVRTIIDNQIAAILGRPAERGHTGEYIAAAIFGITLEASAANKGSDGIFASGLLAGRSVNIKWYGKHENVLDINPNGWPDYYLVLTGPKGTAASSRNNTRPWVISYIFLFDASQLKIDLQSSKIGVATSIRTHLWRQAEIYPEQNNLLLTLSEDQKKQLALFAPEIRIDE
jgi:hypothetical protein